MAEPFRLLYRDLDRLPYLLAVAGAAARRGLTLELVRHEQIGREDWGEKLRRGEVDAIGENYWALVRYRFAGDPFLTVASATHAWRDALLVRPGITSLADLRGKRFAARAAGPQIWFPQVYFRQAGLLDEIEIVQVPEAETGRWGHWKRVADGDCAGCFMSRLYIDDALAAGLRELPYAPWPFEGGHVCPTVTEDVVARRGQDVQALVSAMFDACRDTSNAPQNLLQYTQRCVDDLRSYSPLTTEAEVARLNERFAAEIAPLPVPRADGLVNALAVLTERFPELVENDPLIMWDLSFARAAMREHGALTV